MTDPSLAQALVDIERLDNKLIDQEVEIEDLRLRLDKAEDLIADLDSKLISVDVMRDEIRDSLVDARIEL